MRRETSHRYNRTPIVSARKHSRTSFHMRDRVAAEIQKLEREDIVEKVSGPTEWCPDSSQFPSPKALTKYVRVRVDMRDANHGIQRTRHITPTIEEPGADLAQNLTVAN